jgi:HEAT repeat protein
MYSAGYLLDLHNESCLDAAVTVAQSGGDSDSRVAALSLLPRFQHAPVSESKAIMGATLKALADRESGVRIAAGDALAEIGDSSTILYLQRAIATEQDEAVRSRFHVDIERLQGNK